MTSAPNAAPEQKNPEGLEQMPQIWSIFHPNLRQEIHEITAGASAMPEPTSDYRDEFFAAVKSLIDSVSTLSDYPNEGHVTAKGALKAKCRKAIRKLYQLAYGGTDSWAEHSICEVTNSDPPKPTKRQRELEAKGRRDDSQPRPE